MASRQEPHYTPQQYLDLERTSRERHEYLDGRVYAMMGGTLNHARIIGNVQAELRAQLRGRPCEAFTSEVKIRVDATGLHTYPDVSALCGTPRLAGTHDEILLNPSVLVEVLSRTTESYDRGEKFAHYRRLPSLQEYLLLAQDRMHAERFVRSGERGDEWLLTPFEGADAVVMLPSIGCALRLGDVHERVELPATPPLRTVYERAELAGAGSGADGR